MPEPGKQEVGPGVVGLVAQDGAAGVAGDDGGDGHQAQADRAGLPGAGGGVGQGEQLGEGQQAGGPGPRSGTRYGSGRTPARGSGQVRCLSRSGCGPRSGPVAGGGPRGRRAGPLLCWWRRRSAGSRPRPRSAAGRPGGVARGAGSPASPWAKRSGPAGRRVSATSAPCLGSPSVLYAGVQAASGMVPVDLRRVVRQGEPHTVGHPGGGPGTQVVSFVPPAPSMRTSTRRPGRGPSPAWSRARRMISTWSAAVFDPAFPGRSMIAAHSPPPWPVPWSIQAVRGW